MKITFALALLSFLTVGNDAFTQTAVAVAYKKQSGDCWYQSDAVGYRIASTYKDAEALAKKDFPGHSIITNTFSGRYLAILEYRKPRDSSGCTALSYAVDDGDDELSAIDAAKIKVSKDCSSCSSSVIDTYIRP